MSIQKPRYLSCLLFVGVAVTYQALKKKGRNFEFDLWYNTELET